MTLLQGDCMELLRDVPDGSIDMVLCDLPYGCTANPWDTPLDMKALWPEYKRVAKQNAAIVLFGRQPFSSVLVTSAPDMFRYSMIWRKDLKGGFLNAKHMPMRAYEELLVFYRRPPTYNPQMIPRTYQHKSGNKFHKNGPNYGKGICPKANPGGDWLMPDDVIDEEDSYALNVEALDGEVLCVPCARRCGTRIHPTQKPVSLMAWLIRTYTNPGETVLDNCMGSGSTGVAAIETGRDFIGMESDPGYFQSASLRLEDAANRAGADRKAQ